MAEKKKLYEEIRMMTYIPKVTNIGWKDEYEMDNESCCFTYQHLRSKTTGSIIRRGRSA
jgi:hypothetical protein